MAIRYKCHCGNQIQLPNGSAGRRARCRSCGTVFEVPLPHDDVLPPPFVSPAVSIPAKSTPEKSPDDPASFFSDLASAFLVFLNGGGLAAWVALTLAVTIAAFIPALWGLPSLIMSAYVAAFCLNSVSAAAAGDRELPEVWVRSIWDDLVVPFVQFSGTSLMAMLPLLAARVYAWSRHTELPIELDRWLVGLGLAMWPAILLTVAIGGTLSAARPDIIIRTILSAPLGYLAICAAVGVAAGLWYLVDTRPLLLLPGTWLLGHFVSALVNNAVALYATIVATQVVGLFYKHYKSRFPWTAE